MCALPGVPAPMAALKRILLGQPLSSADEHHQRLSKKIALPVFTTNTISSTAYATDEILVVIVLQAGVGLTAFRPLVPIAIIVCILMAIVVTSSTGRRSTPTPSGGGAYIVSHENLGVTPALVAGSSLLVDYILTVAVSVAGGVLAIRTATGFDTKWTVLVCLGCVFVMTVMNLRGVKESGAALADPDVLLHHDADPVDRHRALPHLRPARRSNPRAHPERGSDHGQQGDGHPRADDAVAGVLVGCRRPVGRRGRVERRPAFQKPEAKNAATTLMSWAASSAAASSAWCWRRT